MIQEEPIKRSFLKWAGGKARLSPILKQHLPKRKILVEPFAGAAGLFMNTDYPKNMLNDVNQDLIALYQLLQKKGPHFIKEARLLFQPKYNNAKTYYQLRQQFNQSTNREERAQLFLYLNRHGYNGLCRYNRSGGFNVPFGQYKNPYFPEKELIYFYQKAANTVFTCQDFRTLFDKIKRPQETVIYCDPPYVPLSKTAHFTRYSGQSFDQDSQEALAQRSLEIAQKGAIVLISNHDTAFTRRLYQGAKIIKLTVSRTISCQSLGRKKAAELLVIYSSDALAWSKS